MWQRIQTLYLGVATALIVSLFFCNFAKIIGPEGDIVTIAYHERLIYLILIIIAALLEVFALSLFKIRLFQMRVCIVAAIVLLGMQIWLGVDVIRNMRQMAFSLTTMFPIVAAILDALASRAIMLDEAKVRSASHLRAANRLRPDRKK